MKQKLLILIISMFAASMLSSVFGVRIVFANPSQGNMTCKGGLYYEAHDYPKDGNSTITAYIDSKRVKGFPKSFGPTIEGTIPNPDKTVPHTWKLVWDRSNGSKGDRSQEGSVDSCVIPPTTPSTTTTIPKSSTPSSSSTSTVQTSATTTSQATTTSVLTDIDTPAVPTTTNAPTTTTDIGQPPAPTGGLPATGIDISTVAWGCILILAGVGLLIWNKRAIRKRKSH